MSDKNEVKLRGREMVATVFNEAMSFQKKLLTH